MSSFDNNKKHDPGDKDSRDLRERDPENGGAGEGEGAPGPERDASNGSAFDPASLRMRQDFGATLGVKQRYLRIPVRKPDRHSWVQIRKDPAYQLEPAAILERKGERGTELYIVTPDLVSAVSSEIKPKALYTAIDTRGVMFIWVVPTPRADGLRDPWGDSMRAAAGLAMNGWVRVASNMSAGCYEAHTTDAEISEPEWPDLSFGEILKIAFDGRVIDDPQHPVLREIFVGRP